MKQIQLKYEQVRVNGGSGVGGEKDACMHNVRRNVSRENVRVRRMMQQMLTARPKCGSRLSAIVIQLFPIFGRVGAHSGTFRCCHSNNTRVHKKECN